MKRHPRDIAKYTERRKLVDKALRTGMRLHEMAKEADITVAAMSFYMKHHFPEALDRLHTQWVPSRTIPTEEAFSRVWMLMNAYEGKLSRYEGSQRLGLGINGLHEWEYRNCRDEGLDGLYDMFEDLAVQLNGYPDDPSK